jgi:hypothetical protein
MDGKRAGIKEAAGKKGGSGSQKKEKLKILIDQAS